MPRAREYPDASPTADLERRLAVLEGVLGGASGELIFADTIDDIDLTAGQVEIASVTETLAVGDIIIIEAVLLVFNNGANQFFRMIPDYDDVYGGASIGIVADGNAGANRRQGFIFRDQMQIHSSSSTTRLMTVTEQGADQLPTVESVQGGGEMEWDEDSGDLTAFPPFATVITVDVSIQTGGAAETVAGSITIRKISST